MVRAPRADHAKRQPDSARRYTSATSVRRLEADHHGEIVAIDVDSGKWAVADGEVVAVKRLRELRPSAVNVLCERVGYRALRSFGAGSVQISG